MAPLSAGAYPPPRIRLARPDVGDEEIEAVTRVLRTPILTAGDETAGFEREFAAFHGIDHGVAFANGTVALAAIYIALGIGPGDEVIVPSLTFISSVTSVIHVGATPVFAEVDPDTFNIDPADVARRIGPRVKAVLAVHYGGQPADMAELAEVASDAGVVLLEDAAEAHGATYRSRSVGGLARAAMFSFTPTKNITTGEGGMVTTADGELAGRLRLLRDHGRSVGYEHHVVGWNWRITEMQAAMGRCQVAKLPAILARKKALAAQMDQLLAAIPGVQAPLVRADREHVHMLYTLKLSRGRDAVLEELLRAGVEARIYFPPVHRQPIFADLGVVLPVTEEVCAQILSVPLHSKMTTGQVEEVAEALRASLAVAGAGA